MNLALLAAAATGVQVGATIVASRHVVADVPPLTLALLRYTIGFLTLLPFVWRPLRAHTWPAALRRVHGRDLLAMAALGVGQFAVLIALLNVGLQHIAAARAAVIFSLFPLLTLLIASALGSERITPSLLAGVALTIAGVALTLWPRLAAGGAGHWWGEAAVFGSALTGAVCSVLYRPYLLRYPTVPVSALAMGASVLVLALLGLAEHWPQRVAAMTVDNWAVVAFIGLSSGVGYIAWLYALKHEPPTRVTVFLSLNPVTAACLGMALLGEPIDLFVLGALPLIALGLWLATRARP